MIRWFTAGTGRGGSDDAQPARSGMLMLTLGGVPREPQVLLDLAGLSVPPGQATLWPGGSRPSGPWSLSLLAGQGAGLSLRIRGPGGSVRHALPGPLVDTGAPLAVILKWTLGNDPATEGRWSLTLEDNTGQVLAHEAGPGALAPAHGLLRAAVTPGPQRFAHPVLGACAACVGRMRGPAPQALMRGAAIAAHAPVPTPGGARPLGTLSPGSAVVDADGQPLRLAALHLAEVPLGLPFSPLRLRAGRLPMPGDLLAGPDTRLILAGDDLQRVLGEARVAVRAGHLPEPVRRAAVLPMPTVPMAVAVPERAAILRIGGLAVLCPGPDGIVPDSLRCLSRQETAAFLAEAGEARLHAGAA